MRLREQANGNGYVAGKLLLAAFGVPVTAESLAGATLAADAMLAVTALAKGFAGKKR